MRSLLRPQDWPIVTKLIVAFLLVALIPLLIVGIASPSQARDGLLQSAQLNLINAARRTSAAVDGYINGRRDDVQQTARDESVIGFLSIDRSVLDLRSNRDALATRRLLTSRASALGVNNKAYYFVARVDKDPNLNGRIELTSNVNKDEEGAVPAGEANNVSDQVYFQEAVRGYYYITDPVLVQFGETGVEALMYYSAPVYDKDNKIVGVVVSRSNMFPIWQIVNGDDQVAGPGSFGMLVDNTNRLGIRIGDSRINNQPQNRTTYLFSIMRTLGTSGPSTRTPYIESNRFPDNFNYQKAQQPLGGVYESAQSNYNANSPFFNTSVANDDARVGYTRLGARPNWYYYVVVPQATYAAAANNITNLNIIVLIGAILLVVLLALVFARLLTSPVRRISRVLTRIGIGDFDARVPVTSADELGRLGESLNAMFDNTLTLIQTREEKEELQDRITILLNEISTVAEGDLTVEAEVTADITGAIADSFNLMIEELRKVILNIQQATGQASTLFDQMVYNTQRTDQAADRQASRVMNVSSVIGDVDRSIQQVSENTSVSAQVAQEARENAHLGGLAVTKSVASMNRIRGNVQETAKKIKRLGESSQQIGEIVKLIDDIADQTNMLALNAAIQAAMAGEQGKGFSVVAEEVRRLAERSTSATREIATLVKSIQDDTHEAVVAMEESTREVVEGSKVADEAGRALSAIETVVERLADLIFSITQVTQQQATSSRSLAQGMNEISALTSDATNLRRESAQAVEQVARILQALNASVSTFRVSSEDKRASLPPSATAQPTQAGYKDNNAPPFSEDQLHELAFSTEEPTYRDQGYAPFVRSGSGASEQNLSPAYGSFPPPVPTTAEEDYSPAAADAGSNGPSPRPIKNDDFDLQSLMADDADFFDTIFGDGGKKGENRTTRPSGSGTPGN